MVSIFRTVGIRRMPSSQESAPVTKIRNPAVSSLDLIGKCCQIQSESAAVAGAGISNAMRIQSGLFQGFIQQSETPGNSGAGIEFITVIQAVISISSQTDLFQEFFMFGFGIRLFLTGGYGGRWKRSRAHSNPISFFMEPSKDSSKV